jgi:TonB family protein
VLLLRRPLRKAFGARVAYAAWGVVPAALAAVLLPAAEGTPAAAAFVLMPPVLPAIAAQPVAGNIDPRLVLAACWLAGLVTWVAWMAARQLRFRRSLGRLVPRTDGLHESERDVEGLPATLRWWSPQVVVPPAFEHRFDAAQRELMLAHDRAHVRRGDLQANAFAAGLRCLFWFNPLVHIAMPHFRQDQELACDATVLALHPHARRRYGEALLHAQLTGQATPLGCHFGFGHPLKERIAMLREQLPSNLRRLTGSALVTVIALGFGFAAWAAQPPQAAPQSDGKGEIEGVAMPPPKYPAAAAEHNLSGRVVLLVDVAPDGSVANAVVERSNPEGVFDAVALEAVKNWRFNPAMKDGKAVAGRVRVPIDFKPEPKQGEEAKPMKVAGSHEPDPAAYDWVKIDFSDKTSPREVMCDVMKGDPESNVMYCGILKK